MDRESYDKLYTAKTELEQKLRSTNIESDYLKEDKRKLQSEIKRLTSEIYEQQDTHETALCEKDDEINKLQAELILTKKRRDEHKCSVIKLGSLLANRRETIINMREAAEEAIEKADFDLAAMATPCKWQQDDEDSGLFTADCGFQFYFDTDDGIPDTQFKFCPSCGKPIEEIEWAPEEDEA